MHLFTKRAGSEAVDLVKACLLWMFQKVALCKPLLQPCSRVHAQPLCKLQRRQAEQMHLDSCLDDPMNHPFMLRVVLCFAACECMQYKQYYQNSDMISVRRQKCSQQGNDITCSSTFTVSLCLTHVTQ